MWERGKTSARAGSFYGVYLVVAYISSARARERERLRVRVRRVRVKVSKYGCVRVRACLRVERRSLVGWRKGFR